ncbi:hypothetical protein JCM10914A_24560 [Paenibacillus sp. JCM 10914]|uniref:hypothetical protein n=1 Tax=Paenibacillus sp. JCM 10914 TaxID=1236974 RepID=UPI0003CC9D40|nr:hypothetical protein [Paenibacillus sp. JCM 10914]GAE06128.1 hypothetical protein JCM10914_2272 [Paenibacillus sp. JCM 10914]
MGRDERDPLDQELKDSLKKGTDESMDYQDEIWAAIKERIHNEPAPHTTGVEDMQTSRSSRNRRRQPRRRVGTWVVGTAAAAIIVLGFSFQTAPVQAMIDQVKEWFAPQKTVEQELEGMPETSEDSLQEGADYVIYIDESRFQMVKGEGVDRIELKEKPEGDLYPEVFMEISQVSVDPATAAKQVEGELKDYTVTQMEQVQEPIQGWSVHALGGTGGKEWDDPVLQYYVMDNGQGGSFVVKQQYFLEASEGFGARFHNMMKEFHITTDMN